MRLQKGFVLVSVLIITTISTMLALSQMQGNRIQERIAGNQQKEISARLAAEKGIFVAFDAIANGEDINRLVLDNEDYSFPSIDSTSNTFTLVSKGTYQGAESYLKTTIKRTINTGADSAGDGYFENAIVGCESVELKKDVTINGNIKVWGGIVKSHKDVTINGVISEYTGECDPLHIVDYTENGEDQKGEISKIKSQLKDTPDNFTAAENSTIIFDNNYSVGGASPEKLTIFGESTDVYVYDDFKIKDQDLLVKGDVTLYITGKMETENTDFTLAVNSSLTIYIEKEIKIKKDSNIFANNSVSNNNGKIPLTVYSSNEDNAVKVESDSDSDIYMNLYAPSGTISYKKEGAFYGALRGNKVTMDKDINLYYDEGLAGIETSISSSDGVAKTSFCSLYYYYPGDLGTVETLEAEDYSVYCGDDLDISPFKSYAAIAGGAITITANSTVNGDLAAQAAVTTGAGSIVENIYAGAAVTTGAGSSVENIFSGAAAGIGADATAQNIYAEAAINVGAGGQVQAVYAGAAITLGAGASTTGVLTEDANADDYVEAGDIHNAGNMTDMLALITETQSALFALEPSPENETLLPTMGTSTLAPGVWEGSALSITAGSIITFDAADKSPNNEDYVWVINLSGALTVGASTDFVISGLGINDTASIIWNVGAALTMDAGTSFRGTAFVGGAVTAATSSVSCGHLYATGAINIGSIGVDSAGDAVTCENSAAVFTYLETLN